MKSSIFNFNQHGVRVVFDASGEPLFCLADVSKALEIQRANPSRFNLNPKGVHRLCTLTNGGSQMLIFISEENLLRIIFKSTKPEALNFQTWVFAAVLPTIRKTGSYSVKANKTTFDEFNRLCLQEKASKEKATFHSHGMNRRKHEKRLNAIHMAICKTNL